MIAFGFFLFRFDGSIWFLFVSVWASRTFGYGLWKLSLERGGLATNLYMHKQFRKLIPTTHLVIVSLLTQATPRDMGGGICQVQSCIYRDSLCLVMRTSLDEGVRMDGVAYMNFFNKGKTAVLIYNFPHSNFKTRLFKTYPNLLFHRTNVHSPLTIGEVIPRRRQ